MKIARHTAAAAAATILVGTGIVAVAFATPASAAGTCPLNFVCVFQDADYGGGSYEWLVNDADPNFNQGQTFSNGVRLNDNISSLINGTSKSVQFCTDANYAGHCVTYPSLSATAQVAYNDQYSSVRFK